VFEARGGVDDATPFEDSGRATRAGARRQVAASENCPAHPLALLVREAPQPHALFIQGSLAANDAIEFVPIGLTESPVACPRIVTHVGALTPVELAIGLPLDPAVLVLHRDVNLESQVECGRSNAVHEALPQLL